MKKLSETAHRRFQYALIFAGIFLVAAGLAWAANRLEGNLVVTGDITCQQTIRVTDDVAITDDLTVADDATISGASTLTGDVSCGDSLYVTSRLTAGTAIKAPAIIWQAYTGVLPDTTTVSAGYSVARGDTIYRLSDDKGEWTAFEP